MSARQRPLIVLWVASLGLLWMAAVGRAEDSEKNNPFYAFRAGPDIPLLPILHLDINANYRFENWGDLSTDGKSVDTDTITLGAAVRLAF